MYVWFCSILLFLWGSRQLDYQEDFLLYSVLISAVSICKTFLACWWFLMASFVVHSTAKFFLSNKHDPLWILCVIHYDKAYGRSESWTGVLVWSWGVNVSGGDVGKCEGTAQRALGKAAAPAWACSSAEPFLLSGARAPLTHSWLLALNTALGAPVRSRAHNQ